MQRKAMQRKAMQRKAIQRKAIQRKAMQRKAMQRKASKGRLAKEGYAKDKTSSADDLLRVPSVCHSTQLCMQYHVHRLPCHLHHTNAHGPTELFVNT